MSEPQPGGSPVDADSDDDVARDAVHLGTARRAVRQVRREAHKAATVYAIVDGTLVAALAALVLSVVEIDRVPETVDAPEPVAELAHELLGLSPGTVALSGTVLVAAVIGLLVVIIDLWRFSRRPAVEWFEGVNPATREALRTTRDVAADGDDRPMARALYRDTLHRLRAASGVRLIDPARVLVPIVLVILASVLVVLASVAGLSIDLGEVATDVGIGERPPEDGGDPRGPDPQGGGGSGDIGGLAPGDAVLGDPTEVDPGSVDVPVEIDTGGLGNEDLERNYESGGFPSDANDVVAQEAGFAPPEEFEDADLVREYNVRIRETTGNASTGGGTGG